MPLGFKELNTMQLQIGISETPNRDCYKWTITLIFNGVIYFWAAIV